MEVCEKVKIIKHGSLFKSTIAFFFADGLWMTPLMSHLM